MSLASSPTRSTTAPPISIACSPIVLATRFTRATGDWLRDPPDDRLAELRPAVLERLLADDRVLAPRLADFLAAPRFAVDLRAAACRGGD